MTPLFICQLQEKKSRRRQTEAKNKWGQWYLIIWGKGDNSITFTLIIFNISQCITRNVYLNICLARWSIVKLIMSDLDYVITEMFCNTLSRNVICWVSKRGLKRFIATYDSGYKICCNWSRLEQSSIPQINTIPHPVTLYWHWANQPCSRP